MIFRKLLTALLIIHSFLIAAQEPAAGKKCGTPVPAAAWDNWFNERVEEYKILASQSKVQTTFKIPVIVHVIHGGQANGVYPNVSQAQVNSQIPVLNSDFAGTGFNAGLVPQAFNSLVSDCGISFCLAQLDPNGNSLAEAGIDRVNYNTIQGAVDPLACPSSNSLFALFDNTIKPATIWDPKRYFNIWISDVNQAHNILGYASFPAGTGLSGLFGEGTATNDGIWIWSRCFGTIGVISPYNKGRTATHETGHWLGLRHIWGDNNCGNDYCNDTPVQQSSNFSCPSFPKVSCNNGPNGDMFMNFMDYCDDPCLYMFSPDQRTRMHTALTNGIYRSMLSASSATMCDIAANGPIAFFSYTGASCVDSMVYINNQTTGFPGPTYSWTASPSAGVTFSPGNASPSPTLHFLVPGNYTITVTATNSEGNSVSADILQIKDCGDTDDIKEIGSDVASVSIFPNPGNGILNVEFEHQVNYVGLKVINMLGAEVYQEKYSNPKPRIMIDLRDFYPGVYTLIIDGRESHATRRFLISR